MTSCVAKRKYTEAQNTITQLQTENAQLRETGTSMQTNLTSLEARNRALQTSLDSTNTWVSGQQTRWNSYAAFYDQGTKTTEQVHQQLHTQLDDMIGAENITSSGGRVVVMLAEKTLFAAGSSRLSAKGAEVLATLAQAIKDNPNVEIDIASAPGYYASGSMTTTSANAAMSSDPAMQHTQQNSQDMSNAKIKTDDDLKYKDDNTKVKIDQDGDMKVKTSGAKTKTSGSTYAAKSKSSSYSGAAKTKTSTGKSTVRRTSSESKSKTYASNPARKSSAGTSATWSLNMARSGAIAKKLVDEGVAKSRILVNNAQTSTSGSKDFQVIISPKSDTYYETIGNGMNK